jgi:hypothetical protein
MMWVATRPRSTKRTGLPNGTSGIAFAIGRLIKVVAGLGTMLTVRVGTTGQGKGPRPAYLLRLMLVSLVVICC